MAEANSPAQEQTERRFDVDLNNPIAGNDKHSNVKTNVSFSNLKLINTDTNEKDAIKLAWKAIRDVVALKMMGEKGCAVPYLHEGTKYGLMNVIVKERRRLTDKLSRKPSLVHWSAPLEDLLHPSVKLADFKSAHRIVYHHQNGSEKMTFHLKNNGSEKMTFHLKNNEETKKDLKSIDVTVALYNVKHYQLNSSQDEVPIEFAKHFDGTEYVERIYLITEVYVANAIQIDLTIGDRKFNWISPGITPVGIVFKKCDLTSSGILKFGPEVERAKAIQYNWVSAEDQGVSVKKIIRSTLTKKTKEASHETK